MNFLKKAVPLCVSAAMAVAALTGCSTASSSSSSASASSSSESSASNVSLSFNNAKWKYDSTNDVYYQIQVTYCAKPAATKYETLGIYVPGAYMNATKNSDGTYTCTINKTGKVSGYTSSTAPVVFPVDTPGYASQAAPTSYDYNSISSYVKAGYVYVIAGMRGRASMMGGSSSSSSSDASYSNGAPWGVTDLKAAVRYYRYNKSILPGNTDSVFTYGMSGGGAQSALMGATGDSALYTPYLESIGAAMKDADGNTISDAIAGSMDWCPITSLDIADAAYEWNMGQYSTTSERKSTTFTSALSKDLAVSFATYINTLGLKDEDGNKLSLKKSSSGIYNAGSYYNYMVSEVETSLNNFLSDTKFPYTYTATSIQAGNTPTSGNSNTKTSSGSKPSGTTGKMPSGATGGMPSGTSGSSSSSSSSSSNSGTTYKTAQDYIDSLNTDETWIKYDSKTNTAKITSMEAFVTHCKNATKSVGAFDSIDTSQAENNVFGNGQSVSYHFDAIEAALLKTNADEYAKYSDWKSTYVTDFSSDLAKTDSLGTSMQTRVDMYNPMYFLTSYYSGYKTATVAKYWRIRTGIDQSDTALTTEENLKLALENYSGVKSVDFATVWGLPHTTAERTGNSTDNFIKWVNKCVK